MVYTPADGSPVTTLDVYNLKGRGVAMTMYNTDEVRSCTFLKSIYSVNICCSVDPRICTLVVHNGLI